MELRRRPVPRPSEGPGASARPGASRARRSERSGGFTLIELILALAIGTISLGGLLALTQTTFSASRSIDANLRSLRAGMEALAAIRADLNRCRLVAVAADGTSITYSLPIPAGPGGAFVDDAGEVVWGCSDATGLTPDGTVTLAFVFERTLREADEDQDFNGDGDRADSFDVGHLERTSSVGERLGVLRLDVMLLTGNRGGDVDGDGTADPLFGRAPGGRGVVVRVARIAREGRLRVFQAHCATAPEGSS